MSADACADHHHHSYVGVYIRSIGMLQNRQAAKMPFVVTPSSLAGKKTSTTAFMATTNIQPMHVCVQCLTTTQYSNCSIKVFPRCCSLFGIHHVCVCVAVKMWVQRGC